jgi:hypothetical protein
MSWVDDRVALYCPYRRRCRRQISWARRLSIDERAQDSEKNYQPAPHSDRVEPQILSLLQQFPEITPQVYASLPPQRPSDVVPKMSVKNS